MPDVGSAVGGGASIIGGIVGGGSAKSAAKAQAAAAERAAEAQLTATRETIAAQKEATAQARADLQPYRLAGEKGLSLEEQLLGINPYADKKPMSYDEWLKTKPISGQEGGLRPDQTSRLKKQYNAYRTKEVANIKSMAAKAGTMTPDKIMKLDPGYKFRLNQGLKAIDASSAAARGPGLSGATLKELERYGSDYASSEFGNIFSRASTLAGQGLGAATGQASFSQQGAANAGNATMAGVSASNDARIGAANAGAAGTVAAGNAIGGAINNIGQQFYLKQLLNSGGGSAVGGASSGGQSMQDWALGP